MAAAPKPRKVRSSALTQSASGQDCTLRLPGICHFDPETTVLAHVPGRGKGVGTKENDLHAVYACGRCHDAIDGRRVVQFHRASLFEAMLRALDETHTRMIEAGLLMVKGDGK